MKQHEMCWSRCSLSFNVISFLYKVLENFQISYHHSSMSIHVEVIVVRACDIVVNDCSRWNVVCSADTVTRVIAEKFDIVTTLNRKHGDSRTVIFLNSLNALTQHSHFKLDDFVVLALGQPIAEVDNGMRFLAFGRFVEVHQGFFNEGVQVMNQVNVLAFLCQEFRNCSTTLNCKYCWILSWMLTKPVKIEAPESIEAVRAATDTPPNIEWDSDPPMTITGLSKICGRESLWRRVFVPPILWLIFIKILAAVIESKPFLPLAVFSRTHCVVIP